MFLTKASVTLSLLKFSIEEEYLNKLALLDSQEEYFDARKNSLLIQNRRS